MLRGSLRKALHLVAVLAVASFAVLAVFELAPGGPAYAILGDNATPQQVRQLDRELGLDRPLLVRYGDWVGHAATGDLGESLITKRPVLGIIGSRILVTLELGILSLALALLVSIALGTLAAHRRDRAADRAITGVTVLLISTPSFLTGLLLSYVFAVQHHILPVTGWVPLGDSVTQNLRYAVLPVVALALAEVPVLTKLLRSDMVDTLQEDYILSARASGIGTRRVLFRHALRASSFSILTLAGLSFAGLLGGAVIIENLFAIPGIGQELFQSITNRDFPVVQGIVLVIAVGYVVINAAVDVAYSYLDPRVRAGR